MMTKTNARGRVTAIYLHGVWFFPKPMTKKRKKSVYKMPEMKARIDFFNFEQVYAFQDSLPKNVAQKDEFELMIEAYVKKFTRLLAVGVVAPHRITIANTIISKRNARSSKD